MYKQTTKIPLILAVGLILFSLACGLTAPKAAPTPTSPPPASAAAAAASPTKKAEEAAAPQPTNTPAPTETPIPTVTTQPTDTPVEVKPVAYDPNAIIAPANLGGFTAKDNVLMKGKDENGADADLDAITTGEFYIEKNYAHLSVSGSAIESTEGMGQLFGGGEDQSLELYLKDDSVYMNVYGAWMMLPADDMEASGDFSLSKGLEEYTLDRVKWFTSAEYVGIEKINEIEAIHYRVTENDVDPGSLPEGVTITKLNGDIFVAVEGSYLVHLNLNMTGENLEMLIDGEDLGVKATSAEFTFDLNKTPGIKAELPEEVVKSVQPPDDVPTPEGAVMVTTMSMMGTNFYQYRSEQEPEGIIAFYKEELPKKGWTAGDAIEGQSGMITFTKDKTTLTITVTKNPDTGKTDITVMMTTE